MKLEIGVWIDHRQAVIVNLLGEKEQIRRIRSNIDRHIRYSEASQAQNTTGSHTDGAEDARDRRFSNQLGRYYDVVVHWLSTADSIMIFGPGEAKNELQKRLLQHNLSNHIVGVKPTDKLTARGFATEVRQQFNALNQQHADTST